MNINRAKMQRISAELFHLHRDYFKSYEEDEIFQDLNDAMNRTVSFKVLRNKIKE